MDGIELKKIFAIVIAVIILSTIILVVLRKEVPQPSALTGAVDGNGAIAPFADSTQIPIREALPLGVVVPEPESEPKDGIAHPRYTSPLSQSSRNHLRDFELEVANGQLMPGTVIVYEGDIVRLYVLARDASYTIRLPIFAIEQSIPRDKAKLFQFTASRVGKFPFVCTTCADGDKIPAGYLLIAEQ